MSFLYDGFALMLIGMGMVFFFLVVMIFWILLSAKLSAKFAHLLPDDAKPAPRRAKKNTAAKAQTAAGNDQSTLAAVISAAVHASRQDHK